MKPSPYLLWMLLAVVPASLPAQEVKQLKEVPPLVDRNKKTESGKPPKPPPLPAKPGDAAPAAYYSGTFDKNELGSEWNLLNPDKDRWTMQPKRKSIMFITQNTPCPSAKEGKNLLMLDKQLPDDDFEVIVKASLQGQGDGNRIVMTLFNGEGNYFYLALHRENYNRTNATYFQKYFQGQLTGNFRADTGDHIYMKIDREGNDFTGSVANFDPAKPDGIDQLQWVRMGTFPWIRFQGKLGLCAAGAPPEVSAEFYSVLIRKK